MSNPSSSHRPWWTFSYLWLVIAGPLVVIVASFLTFYVAASGQDPVLIKSTAEVRADQPDTLTTLAPAVQARNHATTGALPVPVAQNKP